MGNGLLSGLLGAVKGGGNAVADISQDERRSLAERLKIQMMHDLNMQLEGSRQKAAALEGDKDRAAAMERTVAGEKGATERAGLLRASQEKIAGDKLAFDREMSVIEQDLKSKEIDARTKQVAIDAIQEVRKVHENGGTVEEANAVFRATGLPYRMEEYVINPDARKGDQVKGWRIAGGGEDSGRKNNTAGADMGKPGKSMDDRVNQLLTDSNYRSSPRQATGNGLLGSKLPDTKTPPAASISAPGGADPTTWQVFQSDGKTYRKTENGPVEMTPEEVKQYLEAINK